MEESTNPYLFEDMYESGGEKEVSPLSSVTGDHVMSARDGATSPIFSEAYDVVGDIRSSRVSSVTYNEENEASPQQESYKYVENPRSYPRPPTPIPSNFKDAQTDRDEEDRRYSVMASSKATTPPVDRSLPATEKLYAIPIAQSRARTSGESPWEQTVDAHDDTILTIHEDEPGKIKTFGIEDVFRYTSRLDKTILILSVIFGLCGGAAIPVMPIVFSQFAALFLGPDQNGMASNSVLTQYTLYFVYLAVVQYIVIALATWGMTRTGQRITRQIRQAYLAALIRQDIDYFSYTGVGECSGRLTNDINMIQRAIAEKWARTIHALATFLTAFVIALALSWKLAAMLLWSVVAGLIVMCIGTYFSFSNNAQIQDSNSTALSLAEEAVSSIRNVKALGAEDKLYTKYRAISKIARKFGRREKARFGASFGLTLAVNYLSIALILWQGSIFITQGQATFQDVFIVELVITQAIYAFIGIASHVEVFSKATAAARKVFQTIDRPSTFDATSNKGCTINPLKGTIKLDNVTFFYPSRPDVTVLSNVNLCFPAGKTTALVGASGSGKSSIIDLILRFYDPQTGHVLLDSVSLSSMNLRWLRNHIGAVNQNPTLFHISILENIRLGLIGTQYENDSEDLQMTRIINASMAVNAHQFILHLPGRYEYEVGKGGSMLSGGQRQRIALARAIVGDPQILLLDEATSAIDTESEQQIISALEEGNSTRTTIVVAHRLSTIKNADNIIVLDKGQVAEQGNHDDLMYKRGVYWRLVKAGEAMDELAGKALEDHTNRKVSDGSKSSAGSTGNPSAPRSVTSNGQAPSTTRSPSLYSPIDAHSAHNSYPAAYAYDRTHTPTTIVTETAHDSTTNLRRFQGPGPSGLDVELDVLTSAGRKRNVETADPEHVNSPSIWTLLRFARGFSQELRLNLFGVLCCVIGGAEEAGNAILFGESTISLSLPLDQAAAILSQSEEWAYIYVGFALLQLFVFGAQAICLGISSENMIHRAKVHTFKHAMRQDVGFYDASPSSTATMVSLISTEAVNMCGLSGFTLGNMMTIASTLVSALAIGIGFGWKLGLVCTATVPFIIGCGFSTVALLGKYSAATNAEILAAANTATEAISDIRTVAILTMEEKVLNQYCDALGELEKKSFFPVIKVALIYAAGQSIIYLCMALGFWYGGTLIAQGEYSPFQFFVTFTCVIFSARSAGYFFSHADDTSRAIKGAQLVKELQDRHVEIDIWNHQGKRLPEQGLGSIQFNNVSFCYPGHDRIVLDRITLTIMPHDRVAIVGPSGCGKSSMIHLIMRYYDPTLGKILFDGEEISKLCLPEYRDQVALVSQDITLYEGDIRENLLMGVNEGLKGAVSNGRLARAIADANLKDFIDSLPDGLNTMIGSKGCMLSGGQKQRIAIARAILRNPVLLLLDEATSALDAESERVVQNALEKASAGRTTITVAHRLNTIRNYDMIYFVENGRVVEAGDHDELMSITGGRYRTFAKMQEMGTEAQIAKVEKDLQSRAEQEKRFRFSRSDIPAIKF